MYYILSYLFKNENPNTIFTVFFSSFDNELCNNDYKNKISTGDEIIFEFENQIIKTTVQNIEFVSEDEPKKYTYKIEFSIPYDFLKNKRGRFAIAILGKYQKLQLMSSEDSIFIGKGWQIFNFGEPDEQIPNNGRWEIINKTIYKITISNDLDNENYITLLGAGFEKDCKVNLINNDTQEIATPQWSFSSATKIIFSISKNTVQNLNAGIYDIVVKNPSEVDHVDENHSTTFKVMIAPNIEISNSNNLHGAVLLGEEQSLYISGEHLLDGKMKGYTNIQFDFFLNGCEEKQSYILTNDIKGRIKNKISSVFIGDEKFDPELLFINENLLCINIKKNITSRKGLQGEKLTSSNIQNASIHDIIYNINVQEIAVTVFVYPEDNHYISSFPSPLYVIFNIQNVLNTNNSDNFDISSPKMIIEPTIHQYEEPFAKEYNINLIGFYGSNTSIPVTKFFYKNCESKYATVYVNVIYKITHENKVYEFVIPHNSTNYKPYVTNIARPIECENEKTPHYNSIFIDYVITEKDIEYFPHSSDTSDYGLNSSLTNADNIAIPSTYKGQINEFIKFMQKFNKDISKVNAEVVLEFNFSSVYVSSGNTRKQNTISHTKNNAKYVSNAIPITFANEIKIKKNMESFKESVINVGTEAALDFALNDYYFSNDDNGFFQKNNPETRESIKKAVLFAYYALVESSNEEKYTQKLIKQFYNSMYAFLNGETNTVTIHDVILKPSYVLSANDITKIMDNNSDFMPPFHEDMRPKHYITQDLQSDIVKSMVMILRNCSELQELNKLLKTSRSKMTFESIQNSDNFTLPSASAHSMCKHIVDSIIFCSTDSGSNLYKQIAKIIIPDALIISGANTTFTFAEQIPQEKDYYMLVPYPDIIDPVTDNPTSLSYIDYGAPILQSINNILKLQSGKCIINPEKDEVLYYKDQIANVMNKWITKTTFLLISDSGKYNGSNIYAAPSELFRHYIQTINSSLIGSPLANIINNVDSIKINIEEGKQENSISNKLGKQLIENIIDNYENIGSAVLKSDPTRTENDSIEEKALFQKGDMLTIFVSISGNIGATSVSINNLFARCVDPTNNNCSSFKQYIINNKGDRIKPLVYAILVPIIDDFIE